ncbi:MAG: YegP family protein [Clostridia bacterium]|nr:YegP family protein [Clostridia bacterium]
MGKFEVKKAKTGFVFNLKAGNGEIIGGSEVYATMGSCNKGIASVAKNAPVAGVEDQTEPDFKKVKHPKFEVYNDKGKEFRFRLKATNGEIILASEGYTEKGACLKGIESVRKNAASPTVKVEE